jgi:hypothetical protein
VGAVDLTVDFPATPGRPLPYPYNYSDMTGAQLFNSTAPQGTWTVVQDGAVADAAWGKITWNTEPQASVPSGSSITVEARAADSEAGLGSETYVSVANATTFNLTGRYIQVRVTMRPNDDALSPVLSDIHICSSQSSCAGAPPRPTTQAGPSTPVARTFQPTPPPNEPGTFNGQVISGVVLYNGQPIRGVIELKSGDVIDATNGRIEIVTVSGRAEFYEGAFKITQPTSANAFTRLELVGGDFSICGARKTSAVRADDKPVRRLWGKGTGKFETKARYSAATVRGTTWLTQDRCDGSLTFSEQGTVGVFDFSLRRTRVLTSGLQYLAEPPPPPTPGNFVGEIKGQVIVNGVPLEQDTQIRSGDTVDVRGGRITLTTTSGAASFFSGRFLVTQTGGSSAFTLLTLVGGDFSGCTTRSRSTSANSADPPKKAVRSLWGTGTGKFQTKSRFSAATVRGTNWLTVDRCDGSLTVVREGTVELFDITLNRTVLVRAGKQYLAPAQRP